MLPLHVVGGKILDSQNNQVMLRGTNYETWLYKLNGPDDPNENPNGWFVKEGHMWDWGTDFGTSWNTSTSEGIATEQAVRRHFREMKNWGLNCCRMHFCIEPWINDIYRAPIDQYRYHLYRCAEIADEEGIYIIYDVWSYKQHVQTTGEWCFFPYEEALPSTFNENAFASWWGEVAAYFGNAPNVLFDVINEPHEGHSVSHAYEYSPEILQHWQQVMNKVVAAVRQTSQNIVICQFSYGPDGWYNTPYGMNYVYDYPITGGNVVYSTHIYRTYNHLGLDKPYLKADLKAILDLLKITGPENPIATDTAPLLIGEIGGSLAEYNDQLAFSRIIDIFNGEKIHFVNFEWWVGVAGGGRTFGILQDTPMMAPPNSVGEILREAALNPKVNITLQANPAVNARVAVGSEPYATMPYTTQITPGTPHQITVDEYVET